jgi:hypothetical protein
VHRILDSRCSSKVHEMTRKTTSYTIRWVQEHREYTQEY